MENLKKWFNFNGTISGGAFLLRWIASSVIQFGGGYMIGYGIPTGIMGLTMLGLIIASVGIVLQFSTLIKRARALFPSYKAHWAFYISYFVVSIAWSFLKDYNAILGATTGIVMLFMFAYSLFKNSGIANHEG